MADILFISPYLELAEIALQVVGSQADVDVKVTRMDEAVELALEAEAQGYQVIVSRGLTASKIKASDIELPVIDIGISGTDILRAFYEAKKLGDRVGIVDVEEVVMGLPSLEKIIDQKLIKYTCENDLDDIVKGIEYLKEKGVDVVIGKIAMAREARASGMEAVIITLRDGQDDHSGGAAGKPGEKTGTAQGGTVKSDAEFHLRRCDRSRSTWKDNRFQQGGRGTLGLVGQKCY